MNIKEARKLQPGAIVRESWGPEFRQGLVLSKVHVKEKHMARTLCQEKDERYDIVVHWLCRNPPRQWHKQADGGDVVEGSVQTRENWEIMVVSHAN